MIFPIYLCTCLFLGIISTTVKATPAAIYSRAKLPQPLKSTAVIYDGFDSIFLFGGSNNTLSDVTDEILRFNITSDTISVVGNMPKVDKSGSLQQLNNRFIYFPGFTYRPLLIFDPLTNEYSEVGSFPFHLLGASSQKYNDSSIVILGGQGGDGSSTPIRNLNTQTYNIETVGRLPLSSSPTSVKYENKVYTFSSFGPILKLDLDSMIASQVSDSIPGLSRHSSVSDDKYAYLIGHIPFTSSPSNGIWQFDLASYEQTFVPLANSLVYGDLYWFTPPASVYVERLNRIYYFGGETTKLRQDGFHLHNEIWYLDVGTIPEPPRRNAASEIQCLAPMIVVLILGRALSWKA